MKARTIILGIPAGLLVLAVLIIFIDGMCATPHYELEWATVRKVVKDGPWGYINQESKTLVRFDDGLTWETGGDRGAPGERIKVWRQRGVDTPFGILARRE
jgi:hypothetical protein